MYVHSYIHMRRVDMELSEANSLHTLNSAREARSTLAPQRARSRYFGAYSSVV